MDTRRFWDEELRDFPHGGRGAAVWLVRRDGGNVSDPLRILFTWACGRAAEEGLDARLPLGTLLRSMLEHREELVFKGRDTALWVEPLLERGQAKGCLAIWFDAEEPWREGLFLWGQRLSARLQPVLGQLEPCAATAIPAQPTLFPMPRPVSPGSCSSRSGATVGLSFHSPAARGIPLRRPVTVPGIPGCVGCSAELVRLGQRLGPIARSGVNVLLYGESGTGKEIIATALHLASGRRKGPFVAQNCAALPETLFESELFGHRAGAFTGAASEKKGLLEAASGGTFFLDEIGDMPPALQIKLLRAMQERRVRRIGELKTRPVDIRFVAATHKILPDEITAGRFRLDLYYRLKVVRLEVPPLRHRPEDVAPLVAYFLRKYCQETENMKITEAALTALQRWHWPGNVRELENEIQRFTALYAGEQTIRLAHISPEIRSDDRATIEAADLGTLRELGPAAELLEKYLIRKAIAAADGRKAAAARKLGLSRQGLYKKIQRYGMTDLIATETT